MSNISVDDILLVRKNALNMLSQRGFHINSVTRYLSKDRLSMIYNHFNDSRKVRSPILDIHVQNKDSQAYIAWCPADKPERHIEKIGKMFRDSYEPGPDDDLVIIVLSNETLGENIYTYESDNVTIFSMANLKINITRHRLVPPHRVLDQNCAERVLKKLQISRGNLPQMDRFITEDLSCRGDPIARYYGMRVGDIVEITRIQRTSGDHKFYREVVGDLPPNSSKCFIYQEGVRATMTSEDILTKGLTEIVEMSDKPKTPSRPEGPPGTSGPEGPPGTSEIIKESKVSRQLPPLIIDQDKLGQTSYYSDKNNHSYGGYSMSSLNSGLKNYLRKTEKEKVQLVISEIASFYDLYHQINLLVDEIRDLGDENPLIPEGSDSLEGSEGSEGSQNYLKFFDKIMTKQDSSSGHKIKGILVERQEQLAKQLRNFVHTLMTFSVEYCLEAWLPIRLNPLLTGALQLKTNYSNSLQEITLLLLNSRRSRLGNDLQASFLLAGSSVDAASREKYQKILQDPSSFGLDEQDGHQVKQFGDKVTEEGTILDDNKLSNLKAVVSVSDLGFITLQSQDRDYFFSFLKRLIEMDDFAFYWLSKILNNDLTCLKVKTGAGGKSGKCVFLVWKIIKTYTNLLVKDPTVFDSCGESASLREEDVQHNLLENSITILQNWYLDQNLGQTKTRLPSKLPNIFLYYAILLIIKRHQLSFVNDQEYPVLDTKNLELLRENAGPEFSLPSDPASDSLETQKINKKISEAYYYVNSLDDTEQVKTYLVENSDSLRQWAPDPSAFQALLDNLERPNLKQQLLDYFKTAYRDQRYFDIKSKEVKSEDLTFKVPVYRMISDGLAGIYQQAFIPEPKTNPKTTTKKGKTRSPTPPSPPPSPPSSRDQEFKAYFDKKTLKELLAAENEEGQESLIDAVETAKVSNFDFDGYMKNREKTKVTELFRSDSEEEIGDPLLTNIDETNQDIKNFQVDLENFCQYLATNRIPAEKQIDWRQQIGDFIRQKIGKVITLDNFQDVITPEILQYMFNLYDKYFFSNTLSSLSQKHGCVYTICWDNKCTSNAGLCSRDRECKQMKITLYNRVFYDSLKNMTDKQGTSVINSGLKCHNVLECLQITFEHELVHALINCFCLNYGYTNKGAPSNWTSYSSPATGHSKTFLSIVNNNFGHTEYKHELHSTSEQVEAYQEQRDQMKKQEKEKTTQARERFQVGEEVSFQHKGEMTTGIIKKKNPTKAVVSVNGNNWTVPYLSLDKVADI